jgi:hypothetical protein
VFSTFAVAFIVIVTGSGPQAKRMIPPARTAATTAAEVQLAGVPWPTMRSGCAPAPGDDDDVSPNVTNRTTARLTPPRLPATAPGDPAPLTFLPGKSRLIFPLGK